MEEGKGEGKKKKKKSLWVGSAPVYAKGTSCFMHENAITPGRFLSDSARQGLYNQLSEGFFFLGKKNYFNSSV